MSDNKLVLSKELIESIKKVNSVSSLQLISIESSIEELILLLPSLFAQVEEITFFLQRLQNDLSKTTI